MPQHSDRSIESRLRDLESKSRGVEDRLSGYQDQLFTAGPAGGAMISTHTALEAFGVWLAPLDLHHKLRLAEVRLFVGYNTGTVPGFALAIYRATKRDDANRDHPHRNAQPFDLVQVLGVPVPVLTTTSQTNDKEMECVLPKELLLDPEANDYFIGYQCTGVDALWCCVDPTGKQRTELTLIPSPGSMYGLTRYHVGAFRIQDAVTPSYVSAQLGVYVNTHSAILDIVRHSTGAIWATLTSTTQGWTEVSVPSNTLATGLVAGLYDLYLRGSGSTSVSTCREVKVILAENRLTNADGLQSARRTRPLGTRLGDFPAQLSPTVGALLGTVDIAPPPMPIMALRSLRGIRRMGRFEPLSASSG